MGTQKRGRLPPSHHTRAPLGSDSISSSIHPFSKSLHQLPAHTLLVESFGLEDSRFVFLLFVRFKFDLTVVGKVPRRYNLTS